MKYSFPALSLLAVLLIGCADPAADVPAAKVEPSKESPVPEVSTAPAKTAKLYMLSPESTIGFVGSKVTGSHEGGFKNFKGVFSVIEGELNPKQHFKIDTTSLWADNEKLAGHLKSPDFFDTEKFPDATFNSTAITKAGDSHSVTGDLTLHGVTKSITFPASVRISDEQITVAAEFSINRFDFGIKYAGKTDDLIREGVVIKLNLIAKPNNV